MKLYDWRVMLMSRNRKGFLSPPSGARGWLVLLTQGSLRVALGYILPPPSEAEMMAVQAFRTSAFPANELPGYLLTVERAPEDHTSSVRYRV